jgi:hypothetical protein
MEEHFVTYKQALALKELGFDKPCFAKYTSNRLLLSINWSNIWCENINESEIYAPLKQQVFKFLYICSKGEINITYKASDCEDTINNKIDNGIKKLRNIQNNKS